MDCWKMFTLDVWGNEKDGWEVNDLYFWRKVTEQEIDDREEFVKEHLIGDVKQYEIDACSTEGFLEIRHIKSGKPIVHLYKVFE
jgi:hypothetical protein